MNDKILKLFLEPDIDSLKRKLPISYKEFMDAGWNLSEYINYITLCDAVRAEVIMFGSKQHQYCQQCNIYLMPKSEYSRLRKWGVILCQVIDEKAYYKEDEGCWSASMAVESLLKQCGYSVSKLDDLSDSQRKNILMRVVDAGYYSIYGIINHLDMLIATRSADDRIKYSDAINKWIADRDFIKEYKSEDRRLVEAESIHIKSADRICFKESE